MLKLTFSRRLTLLLFAVSLVAGCTSSSGQEATATPATVAETAAPSPTIPPPPASPTTEAAGPMAVEATATEATAAETTTGESAARATATAGAVTETRPVTVNGRTPDGAYFLGREDAPVTMIDYSDFL